MRSETAGTVLRGRRRETDALDELLREVRAGHSRVLVLRGEAGIGKTALLDHLSAGAGTARVVRVVGVEPESEIAYSALQQLCAPLLGHLDGLPAPQRDTLATAFGLGSGEPPEALLVGLAVLGLFAEAAAERPLVCLVDDLQWVDRMSEVILTFVARRLQAESVALVLALRSPGDERFLPGLPELRVDGLPAADAGDLLDTVLPGPVDAHVRERILAETRGNPLALRELPRGLTPAELSFGFGAPAAAPVADRVEDGFRRRLAALPADTRTLLLAAAVEPVGDVPLLWRALDRLGVGPDAAAAAEAAGLLRIGTRVRFQHPLVRSACWRSASPDELRAVHRALAKVNDPGQDPDRHAWHRAHATPGPDDDVAGELERTAGRALARGGRSAAASFLERAAELTQDPKLRAARVLAAARARFASGAPEAVPALLSAAELGPLDPLQRAGVERLRAQAAFALDRGRGAVAPLLEAARRLDGLDPAAARETYLWALGAAMHAGRLGDDDLHRAADAARHAVPAHHAEPAQDAVGLFLTGLTVRATAGYGPAVPHLRRALAALTDDDAPLLWLSAPVAHELWDDAAWHRLTERALASARLAGARSQLPTALTFRAGALVAEARFAEAGDLLREAEAFAQPLHPSAALTLAAHRGVEEHAARLVEATVREAEARGEGRWLGLAGYAEAVLHNGLGRYPAALEAARRAAAYDDLALTGWTLGELVEAAARCGDAAAAGEARERLAERTAAAGTSWALGTQALADALAGPAAAAEDRYREAVELLGGTRLVLQTARARLLYGEWLRRENRRGAARDHLRAAHEVFAAAGAEGFAGRAGRELAATGETVRRRTAGAADTLTAQEAQIARLAVAGRTNPEIGAELFLSPRTVEWHLRKVFGKLGIASRRELAGALRER
ncbi:helix-turn-helix transcriptional regulator [Promicromonospora sukumoe]|uniref:DNA-binding CsgD family transcriptional regulator/propanediol dehydratase small subunit n=2 Tax=Promicromonospora sukumoe TaxID=88382 RepID=A0A7W3JAS1_9MICO|nr:LuxR family transcriptional regulator [Promicromonospora sukumoe]MBA8809380.1 DNA-binding CsgD family transcriptional regulator/propanediol dehydratase small subunit [Promicromonospora sukumoe]